MSRRDARPIDEPDGVVHDVDVLIHDTGFEASRFLAPMDIVGRAGEELHEHWAGDARAHLGLTVPGFPNLSLLYGPSTKIVVNGSIVFFSECGARAIVACIHLFVDGGCRTIECREAVHDAFNERVDGANRTMAWGVSKVNSWYKNDGGRVSQNWPFSLLDYWRQTRAPAPSDYDLR
jgi:4-hydroxyacetophenone monooxygenase